MFCEEARQIKDKFPVPYQDATKKAFIAVSATATGLTVS